ncbi:MAG: ynfM 2 [Rhizobacter sp.]|nr:ynfM 2 [Rhizobacter sp.]
MANSPIDDLHAGGVRKVDAAVRTPRAVVLLLAIASGLTVANVYYAQPLLDALAIDFGIGDGAVGFVVTATQIGSVLALALLVPLGDRVDRKTLMLWQLAALCVSLVAVSVAETTPWMLGAMLCVGLLGTAMTQGLIAYAASVAGADERGRVVGTVQGGVMIGLLLARVFSGALADVWNWRAVYASSAGISLLLAIALSLMLDRPATPPSSLRYRQLLRSMVDLLAHDRVLRARGVIALLMFAALSIFWSAVALPLSAPPHAFSHTAIGALGLVGVVGALAAARSGRWADRGLGEHVTGVALLLLTACWLPLAFMPASVWALVTGVVLLDLAGQAVHVTNQSMIFASRPEAASRLVGCYMVFYALGSGLGAIGATQAYALGGWTAVCGLGAFVSVVAFAFWRATLPRRQASCVLECTSRPSTQVDSA